MRYIYLGDKLTMASALVVDAYGNKFTVLRRRLRLLGKYKREDHDNN
jgi:hypothetical protein